MLSSGNTDTLTIVKDDEAEKIIFTAASGSSGGDKTYHGTENGGIAVDNVNNTITISANYLSSDALNGYTTSAQVSSIVEGYGYQDAAQVSAIASAYAGSATGDVTSAQVSAIVEGYGYQTAAQVSAIASGYDTTYTAGTGLKLDGTEFSLTATIPSNSDISGIASSVT
jgi:hypothetical protein